MQSTFDLGGFPFALHITQASTASATAFLRFSQNPLADYAVCERSVQQNYLIKVVLSSTATETFEEKLLRLVRNDSNLNCGEEPNHETETE